MMDGNGHASCPGCDARDREIAYLRERVDKLEERALELLSPGVTRREPPVGAQADDVIPLHAIRTGSDGKQYVDVQGRPVALEVFLQARREGGGIDDQGRYVSPDEFKAAMAKINEMQSGG